MILAAGCWTGWKELRGAIMNDLQLRSVGCPYCGELIEVLFDCSVAEQNYIEDCQVCCRPIVFDVRIEQDVIQVRVFSEDETH